MFTLYDKEAYKLLKECSDKRDMTEWNEYREKSGNKAISMRFANLMRFYLHNANLKNIDFKLASVYGADMSGADVENAKLVGKNTQLIIELTSSLQAGLIAALIVFYFTAPTINTATIFGIASIAFDYIDIAVVLTAIAIAITLFYANYMRINKQIVFSQAKNPELAIGFDSRYKQTDISVEIEKLKQKATEITDENKINEIVQKIDALKQQKTIEKAIESLKKPYKYLEHEIKKLRTHNYFFYILIIASLVAAIYYGIGEYQNRDSYMGVLFGDVKYVDFGSILGISLFYGTPIVFLMFVAVYAVSQINKNIDKIHELSTQKHYIEILESAFNSKTQAGATDEEIQKDLKTAADAIRDATIAKMLGKEPKTEEAQKEERYRDRLDYKAIMPLLTALLKSKA